MNGQELTFANGAWWYVLPLSLLVMLAGFVWLAAWRRRVARALGDAHLVEKLTSTSPTRRTIRRVVWVFGVLLALTSVLRPQFGMEETPLDTRGIDLAIALDISTSMLVPDIAPDRLTGASMEMAELLDMLHGGRVSLVPFAGLAYAQSPLTSDLGAIRIFLRDLSPLDVPVQGTAIGRALSVALDTLQHRASAKKDDSKKKNPEERADVEEEEIHPFAGSKHKAILLVTDGEDHGSEPLEVAQKAATAGIRIYTVGVGSEVGDLVPKTDDAGKETGDKLTDPDSGDLVVSRLNGKLLTDLAQLTGGKFFHYTGRPIAGDIYKEIEQLEKREYAARLEQLRMDRFQFLLVPAFLLLCLELVLSDGRRRS